MHTAESVRDVRLQASRAFFSEVNARFPTLPFTLRAGKDERAWRMGVVECKNHGMFTEYPVLYEKQGEHVAQVRAPPTPSHHLTPPTAFSAPRRRLWPRSHCV